MSARLAGDLFGATPPAFDAAIANPPYRKISTDSVERRALRSVGVETSNLYTGFIALIQRLLVRGGQLVAITPRSFCNGPYFRPFRDDFLIDLELRRLHVFESRQAAFRTDSVLQENIIFHAVKGRNQPREIVISSSSGEHGDVIAENIFPFSEIVHPHDAEKFIHIPSTASHAAAKETMDGLSSSLASLGVTVSTGRVVDFRLKDASTLYPATSMEHWPKLEARKPNASSKHGQPSTGYKRLLEGSSSPDVVGLKRYAASLSRKNLIQPEFKKATGDSVHEDKSKLILQALGYQDLSGSQAKEITAKIIGKFLFCRLDFADHDLSKFGLHIFQGSPNSPLLSSLNTSKALP